MKGEVMNQFQNNNQMPQVSQEQIAMVKDLLSKKGISAETWVRQLCSQRGIDVNEFMKQFQNVTIP